MILPTEKLLELLEKYAAKAVFVDLTYLVRLNKIKGKYQKAQKDWRLIEEQVNKISSLGHYIFYHVHPHWMDAIYVSDSNEWDLSNKGRFSLDNLSDEEIDELFEQCHKYFPISIYKSK